MLRTPDPSYSSGGGGGCGGGLVEDNSHARRAKPPRHAEHKSQQPRFQRRRSERIRRGKELRESIGSGSPRRGLDGRNPLAALVEAGNELRARTQRMLQARGLEMQHMMRLRRGSGGLGRRRNSLAFGNFLARKEEQDGQEELLSAELLAVSLPPGRLYRTLLLFAQVLLSMCSGVGCSIKGRRR